MPVAADAPQGVYTLNVGLYRQVGEQALSLPLVQDGQLAEASSVNIGPIKIGGAPPNLTLNQARPQVMLNQPFGVPTKLTLLGYDLTDENSQPVTTNQLSTAGHQLRPTNLRLTLYWRSEDLLALDYTTFVHLRDAQGETIAQKDQQPLQAAYPTSLWDPGEIIADEVIISLPVEMEHGSHQLVVGMYDFQTGERLPIPGQPDSELKLAALDVP